MKAIPGLSVNGLGDLLHEKKGWVEWLADAVWRGVYEGELVRLIVWCAQNDQKQCKCEGAKRVVSAFRRCTRILPCCIS